MMVQIWPQGKCIMNPNNKFESIMQDNCMAESQKVP